MGFEKFGHVSFTSQTKIAEFVGYLEQGQLMGTKCQGCGVDFFPPRADCSNCYGSSMEWFAINGTGEVMGFTRLNYAPAGFEQDVPYALALVKFDDVKVFGREIHQDDRQKAFIVLSVFVVGLFASIILISAFENSGDIELMAIIFEASSAFGTTGLSMGITADLTIGSQLTLMLLMLIGRVGLVAFLFSIRAKPKKTYFKYPTERIIIG